MQESISGEISLEEEYEGEADVVHVLLEYLYGKPYKPRLFKDDTSTEDKMQILLFHAQLFVAADKYDVPELRLDICDKYKARLSKIRPSDCGSENLSKTIRLVLNHVGDRTLQVVTKRFCKLNLGFLLKHKTFNELLVDDCDIRGDLLLLENLKDGQLRELLKNRAFLEMLESIPEVFTKLQLEKHIDRDDLRNLVKSKNFRWMVGEIPSLSKKLLLWTMRTQLDDDHPRPTKKLRSR